MKKIVSLLFLSVLAVSVFAQKIWLEDPDNFSPTTETTFMMDVSKCDCNRLIGHPGPLYIWTWEPGEPNGTLIDGTEVKGNGDWTASNALLEVTNVGGDVWSFTMIPTEFYGVEAAKVYEKGFKMLLKAFDGTGLGGGGCDEDKTEDLELTVELPPSTDVKQRTMPKFPMQDDILTLIYDNNKEEKETMQNLTSNEAYVYLEVVADGIKYIVANFFGEMPELLKMTDRGDGVFTYSMVPEDFFTTNISGFSENASIESIKYTVRRKKLTGTVDKVSQDYEVAVGCP